ncbi:MAG: hypothetical protein P8171_10540 [Candidatus Thiodiazotropha sp.]
MEIEIIAEGMENEMQLTYLRNLKVEYAQVFHIAKPLNQQVFSSYPSSTLISGILSR